MNKLTEIETCDLCIIGAGMAGLNALFAANKYLTKSDKVILVDKKPSYGGMWKDTYDYVRLHQPHPNFTAGNIKWKLKKRKVHLASKLEILSYFNDCIKELKQNISLIEYFKYEYVNSKEVLIDGKYEVHLTFKSSHSKLPNLLIKAKKCIKSFGFNIPNIAPLKFSSINVKSISPNQFEFLGPEMQQSTKPVYIIGGGKTGMDTAYQLIKKFPGKKIHMITGKGNIFMDREKIFATGLNRFLGRIPFTKLMTDISMRYNGNNEKEVCEYFKVKYGLQLDTSCENFMLGIISKKEKNIISNGIHEHEMDYLEDIVDQGHEIRMILRSGRSKIIEKESWIINCSGHLFREKSKYEPHLSENNTTISIKPSCGILSFSTLSAYFLTHLWFRNELKSLPLYELNQEKLLQQNKKGFPYIMLVQMLHNMILIANKLPSKVMMECDLLPDKWFPFHVQTFRILKMKYNERKYLKHTKAILDNEFNSSPKKG